MATSTPKAGACDRVHSSVYLPRDLRRRLREIAAAEECKVHDLIVGSDTWSSGEGNLEWQAPTWPPSIAAWCLSEVRGATVEATPVTGDRPTVRCTIPSRTSPRPLP